MRIPKIINQLRISNSKLHKEAVLRENSDNEDWKQFLVYVYDPTKTYGIKYNEGFMPVKYLVPDAELYADFDKLANREVTGAAASSLVGNMVKWYGPYVRIVLNRTLDAGVDAKTINKIYGNIIPTFQVMKAKNYEGTGLKFPLYAEIKYDGVNTTILVEGGIPRFFTSSGKELYVKDTPFHKLPDGVYFAEMIAGEGKLGDRQNIQGIQTSLRSQFSKGLI